MRLKKWMGIILSAAMLLALLTGCSSKSPAEADSGSKQSSESKEKTGGTVGILIVTSGSQWCNDIVDSVTEAVKGEGYDVGVSDSQVSVDNELSGMENLINSGCKAIVVNAMNPAGLSDLCKQAQEKGIYIIGWSDLLVNYDALVEENPEEEAELIADAMADFVDESAGEGSEMAAIWLSDSANPDTTAGVFKEALEAEFEEILVKGKGVNLVNSQYATDSTKAMDVTEAILAANPNVKLIFCQSDEMGVAVAQTLEAKGIGKDEVMVCGLDGSEEALNVIAGNNSTLRSTVYANTKLIGQKVGEAICKYMTDNTAENVIAEYVLINSDNASEYVTQ